MPTERARKRLQLIAERARELAKQVVRDMDPVDSANDDEGEETLQFDLELRADLRERDGNSATVIQQDET
jgi:hypothetical protein